MKKFYITTSLAYTNSPPHIGFALELIQADVIARYQGSLGKETFFLTGTDEHGAKVAKAAQGAGEKPQEFCNKISSKFKDLTKTLNISNDDFIRTTDKKRHWPAAEKVWLKLKENDDLYKKKYKGLYCSGCEAFVTKKDLKDEKCLHHEKKPEIVKEENYFFKLSKYSKAIESSIEKDKLKIIPQTRKNEILSFIRQGLEDVSFSRPRKDLKWGIPVPDDSSQTMYVWVDALSNYISALDYVNNGKKFQKFWPADMHCIGKDIIRFHAIYWPGMLLAIGLPLPRTIFVHGFITAEGQKISKSLGNIIDPFELVKKYGVDPVRYYLLREIPSYEDGDFGYDKFEERYNADLANGLGNLIARVLTLATKFQISNHKSQITNNIKAQVDKTRENYKKAIEEIKLHEALGEIWKLISFCDNYIEQEKPWQLSSPEKVLNNLLYCISEIANLIEPFLPETSEKIKKQLKSGKSEILFPRL